MAEVRDTPGPGIAIGLAVAMIGICVLFCAGIWIAHFGFRWPGQ